MDYTAIKRLRTEDDAVKALENGLPFTHISFSPFRDSSSVALCAVRQQPSNVCYLGERMKDNDQVAELLFSGTSPAFKFTNWPLLGHLSERLRNNSKVVLMALQSIPDGNLRNDLIDYHASPRIQELCSHGDPISALKADLLAERLTQELAPKPPSRSTKLKI